MAAHDHRLKAAISQCPFTDGFRSAFTTGFKTLPGLLGLGLRDTLFGTNEKPVTVALVGKPGEGKETRRVRFSLAFPADCSQS